jgi:hypothetical protein
MNILRLASGNEQALDIHTRSRQKQDATGKKKVSAKASTRNLWTNTLSQDCIPASEAPSKFTFNQHFLHLSQSYGWLRYTAWAGA